MEEYTQVELQNLSQKWMSGDKEIQKENAKLFPHILEMVKGNTFLIKEIWEETDKEVQRQNAELFPQIVELIKEDPFDVEFIWINTDKEVQKKNVKLFPQIIETVEKYKDSVGKIWMNTDEEVLKENAELLPRIIGLFKNNFRLVGKIWEKTDKEVQKEKIEEIMEKLKDGFGFVGLIWEKTDKEVQNQKIGEMIEFLKENPYLVTDMWINTDKEIQKQNVELLPQIIELQKGDSFRVGRIWNNTDIEIQKEKLNEIIEFVKYEFDLVSKVWEDTDKEVKRDKIGEIIELVKEEKILLEDIWIHTDNDIQKENAELLPRIIEQIKENSMAIRGVWLGTDKETQKENAELLSKIIDLVKRDGYFFVQLIWNDTNAKLKLDTFFNIAEMLKKGDNIEIYEEFVKDYLGDNIEFSEDGSYILPKDLERIVSNVNDDEVAEEIDKNLKAIVQNWNEIKQYIQRKRANSIINNGIEVRSSSISEIIEAINGINRPLSNSVSAQELEKTRGAEKIGIDTQYTASPSTAIQRAYSLAEKMDKASSIKKYPNFSVESEDEEICLNVLHPQDKSAILLGYDTQCCFRPNGNADNSSENEYSLLQYCTTTQYGGVLRCESKEKNNVYMGTPFLVNGNCMLFHSYETANEEKADESNELLVKAAQRVIEKSNGSIDIVFMTDLYEGRNRLHTNRKIIIPSYFEAYTDGEYSGYKEMYNNLERNNCVLAARVGKKVLTGETLLLWYIEECHENPEELKHILNLHMGERTEEFDFGKREVKGETIEIQNFELVQEFQKRKSMLETQRETLALVLQMKKLESDKEIDTKKQEELSIIKSKLEGKSYMEISSKSIDELRVELQKNRDEQLKLYSGEDLDLIAEVYNIDIETELRKRAEESVNNKKIKDKKKGNEGKAISILIARTKESSNEKVKNIPHLQQKIAKNEISEEELEILEQSGIDVTLYRRTFKDKEDTIPQDVEAKQKEAEIVQKVRKGMRDTAQKEEIVAQALYGYVTDEEVKAKSKTILRVSLIDELKRKVSELRKGKEYEDLTEQEREEIDDKVQILNINDLVDGIVEGNITVDQQEVLDELENGEYQISIKSHIEKIEDRRKIERRIKNDKLTKLKASITLGMDTQEKILAIKGKIDGINGSTVNIARFIYGNSWYIAIDSEGYVQESQINPEADEYEKSAYEKAVEGQKIHPKEYIEKSSIKAQTEEISGIDKRKLVEEMKRRMEEDRGENDDR